LDTARKNICRTNRLSYFDPDGRTESAMDLKALEKELQEARRARAEAEAAGGDLEELIGQMRAGLTFREIELGLGKRMAPAH
jgi:hypothetical protein